MPPPEKDFLTTLPLEILHQIFDPCDKYDLRNLYSTCRSLRIQARSHLDAARFTHLAVGGSDFPSPWALLVAIDVCPNLALLTRTMNIVSFEPPRIDWFRDEHPWWCPSQGPSEQLAYQHIRACSEKFIGPSYTHVSAIKWFYRQRDRIASRFNVNHNHYFGKTHLYRDITAVLGITILVNLLPNLTHFGSHSTAHLTDTFYLGPNRDTQKPLVTFPGTESINMAFSNDLDLNLGIVMPHKHWCNGSLLMPLFRKVGRSSTDYTEFAIKLQLLRTPGESNSPGMSYITHMHIGESLLLSQHEPPEDGCFIHLKCFKLYPKQFDLPGDITSDVMSLVYASTAHIRSHRSGYPTFPSADWLLARLAKGRNKAFFLEKLDIHCDTRRYPCLLATIGSDLPSLKCVALRHKNFADIFAPMGPGSLHLPSAMTIMKDFLPRSLEVLRFHEDGTSWRLFGAPEMGTQMALRCISALGPGYYPNLRYIVNARDYDMDVHQELVDRGVIFLNKWEELEDKEDQWEYHWC